MCIKVFLREPITIIVTVISPWDRSDRGLHPAVARHQVQQVPQVAGRLAQDEEAAWSYHAGTGRHARKASIDMVARRSFSLSFMTLLIF